LFAVPSALGVSRQLAVSGNGPAYKSNFFKSAPPLPLNENPASPLNLEKKETCFGYPEAIFARINGLLPGIVDSATRAQNRIACSFAKPN
jgi:hypothetical protein